MSTLSLRDNGTGSFHLRVTVRVKFGTLSWSNITLIQKNSGMAKSGVRNCSDLNFIDNSELD